VSQNIYNFVTNYLYLNYMGVEDRALPEKKTL